MKSLFSTVAFSALFAIHANAQDVYKMQPVAIQTRWAKEVSPTNALKEYPRPQMVRAQWQNLNGLWSYTITAKDASMPGTWDGQILVPYPLESALSGVKKALQPDQLLWYKKTIAKPAGEKILLHFGAVDFQATIFVNGKEVGSHSGGYEAFTIDITNALKTGDNDLVVKVYDPTDQGVGPHGKQVLHPASIYYTPTSGIWQTVWLEAVSKTYIEGLVLTPDIDKGVLAVKVNAPAGSAVEVTALDGSQVVGKVKGKAGTVLSLPVKDAKLWSPETPFLYDLVVRLKGDEVKSYFGMRKISLGKDEKGFVRIFLNNKPYFNLGTLDQGFWPDGLYTAPTDEALAFDVKAIKALGFNTIRKHIKVEPDRWYYHCDKLGMLVWQDMVNPPIPSKQAQKEFEKETAENIAMLYNHPSIVVWVVFNEGWGAYDQEQVTNWVKKIDPSRLVNGHTGENYYQDSPKDTLLKWAGSDMTDIHAYPDPQMPPALPGKARVLGEYGGVGAMVTGHQWNDLSGWGYITLGLDSLAKTYQQMMQEVKKMEKAGLSGSIYTQPFDVEAEQNGLITYDRRILKVPSQPIAGLSPAPNEADILNALKKRFEAGNYDSVSVRRLAILSIRTRDTVLAQKAVAKYITMVSRPGTVENLRFIGKMTNAMNDPGFKHLMQYSNVMKDEPRLADVLENMKQMIYKKELRPVLKKIHSLEQWDSVKAVISAKYGDFVEEIVERNEIILLQGQKRWQDFASVAVPYLKKYAIYTDPGALNSFAYDVFLHLNDSAVVSDALGWARMAAERLPNPSVYDTYASLLYKVGRRDEALKMQRIAVRMAPEEKVFEENYEKMKSGTLVWD